MYLRLIVILFTMIMIETMLVTTMAIVAPLVYTFRVFCCLCIALFRVDD